jgi:nucleotide-binding universal stress UspA family protein
MYNKILAPLDGSKLSENSLQHIENLISGCQVGEVILLHVVEKPSPVHTEYSSLRQFEESSKKIAVEEMRSEEMAQKYLNGVGENLKNKGVMVENVVIATEQLHTEADIILDYADKNNIDLIVMSTHGRSGITRWAFGSVADRVIRHALVPVLMVAPAGSRQ